MTANLLNYTAYPQQTADECGCQHEGSNLEGKINFERRTTLALKIPLYIYLLKIRSQFMGYTNGNRNRTACLCSWRGGLIK